MKAAISIEFSPEYIYFFLAIGAYVGEVDAGELVVRLALVHLLLYSAPVLHRVGSVLVELGVGRVAGGIQDLEEGAHRLLNALLVAVLHGAPDIQALADLITIVVLELVMEHLGQVGGDQP